MAIAQNFNYNYDQRRFLNASLVWTSSTPEICYGCKPEWIITLYQDDAEALEGVSPMDLSGIASWSAAVDLDKDAANVPMCRSLGESIRTVDAERGIVSVKLDAETESFLAAVNGKDAGAKAYFELRGYDADGAASFHLLWTIQATMCVDAATDENPPVPVDAYYTRAQIDAKFGAFESFVAEGTVDASLLTGALGKDVSVDADSIASGTIDKERLPTIAADDVPSLDASKIASGTLAVERIPTLPADKVEVDRAFAYQSASSLALAKGSSIRVSASAMKKVRLSGGVFQEACNFGLGFAECCETDMTWTDGAGVEAAVFASQVPFPEKFYCGSITLSAVAGADEVPSDMSTYEGEYKLAYFFVSAASMSGTNIMKSYFAPVYAKEGTTGKILFGRGMSGSYLRGWYLDFRPFDRTLGTFNQIDDGANDGEMIQILRGPEEGTYSQKNSYGSDWQIVVTLNDGEEGFKHVYPGVIPEETEDKSNSSSVRRKNRLAFVVGDKEAVVPQLSNTDDNSISEAQCFPSFTAVESASLDLVVASVSPALSGHGNFWDCELLIDNPDGATEINASSSVQNLTMEWGGGEAPQSIGEKVCLKARLISENGAERLVLAESGEILF